MLGASITLFTLGCRPAAPHLPSHTCRWAAEGRSESTGSSGLTFPSVGGQDAAKGSGWVAASVDPEAGRMSSPNAPKGKDYIPFRSLSLPHCSAV